MNALEVSAIVSALVLLGFVVATAIDRNRTPVVSREPTTEVAEHATARDKAENQTNSAQDVCKPNEPEFTHTEKMPLHGTIFVSIASYRDEACKNTVRDLFEKAAFPGLIYVGVVQQNHPDERGEDCFDKCSVCKRRKENGQIRVKNYYFKDAKVPAFARWAASSLWNGEEFYLQIDSHTKFIQNWDDIVKREWRETRDPMAVLTAYPPTDEQMPVLLKNHTTITNCGIKFSNDGVPMQTAIAGVDASKGPVKVWYAGAGFLFMPGTALYTVPYDPYLVYVFFEEELVHSIRLWTSGFNFYAPRTPVVIHDYSANPKRPRFSNDVKGMRERCERRARTRAQFLWGEIPYNEIDPAFRVGLDKYGLGKQRTLQQYVEYSGIDFVRKRAVSHC